MDTSTNHLLQQHNTGDTLSEYEAALYDRGIRVWGVDAQNRLRKAHVLFVGLTGQTAEACKNVTLSGVGRITIIDSHTVTSTDLSLLLTDQSIGQNVRSTLRAKASLESIKELNPLVSVNIVERDVSTFDDEFIKQFTVVCVDGLDFQQQSILNELCHRNSVSYLLNHSFGMRSFFFADHGHSFQYIVKKKKTTPNTNNKTTTDGKQPAAEEETEEIIEKVARFASLKEMLSSSWSKFPNRISPIIFFIHLLNQYQINNNGKMATCKDVDALVTLLEQENKKYNITPINKNTDFIKLMTRQINAEIAPVCAIVGGVLGQEIVKIISRDNDPFNNIFLYDSLTGLGTVENIL
ncbi:sumo-activating enzyme subunit 1 [Cavenderia fasciculata]|uniref:Sumo-activating enzyme subunit 1 n=1 Tax=Cavenderia fasciculata TaxID=261658 RepID=F4PZY4_CACFS|nr:sumo-activating enzyme subunit 1 [Cavenderia fasciculata]EGG18898.1 sumo-activating enzyme subunit 1 [Cavenderia fasciculata]|eukprot:XP_004357360.1 sumo-activating enzyme subunit 1 [Cavenderia fasciculata]